LASVGPDPLAHLRVVGNWAHASVFGAEPPNLTQRRGLKLFGHWPLYGIEGQAQPGDIQQGKFQNCQFLVALGSMAHQCPHLIDEAIRIHPDTGEVQVRLYGLQGRHAIRDVDKDQEQKKFDRRETWISVNRADLRDNARRGGVGRVKPGAQGARQPIWPALFETALAKALVPERSLVQRAQYGSAGLKQGYARSSVESQYYLAPFLLTGKFPDTFDFQTEGQTPGHKPGQRIDKVYALLQNALAKGCIVTAVVRDEDEVKYTQERAELGIIRGRKDGLRGNHAYMVEEVYTSADAQQCVVLRNPYGVHQNLEQETFKSSDVLIYDKGSRGLAAVSHGPFSVPLKQLYEAGTLSIQPGTGNSGFFTWVPA
jgi:hypothetical protein